MGQVKDGDKVKIHLTGVTGDGMEFTSTEENEPIEVSLGKGEIWPSVEKAILGMKEGESKEVALSSEESIPYVEELVFEISKNQLPEGIPLEEGIMVKLHQEDGRETFMKILSVEEEKVMVDANHPLAGEELKFTVQLVQIV